MKISEQDIVGRLVDASNASMLCEIESGEKFIYKPIAGERPLWDFPGGNLASREVAAFYIDQIAAFNIVPTTVMGDGPFGPGAIQKWIEIDSSIDVMEIAQSHNPQIRNMALFDSIINNTDRKFGHILITSKMEIFGCDHGVTFHEEDKLRTVIWQFSGMPFNSQELMALENLTTKLDPEYLESLITKAEIAALINRIINLRSEGKFLEPNPNWPAVPWPPY